MLRSHSKEVGELEIKLMCFSICMFPLALVKRNTIFPGTGEKEVDTKIRKVFFQALRWKPMLSKDKFHAIVAFKVVNLTPKISFSQSYHHYTQEHFHYVGHRMKDVEWKVEHSFIHSSLKISIEQVSCWIDRENHELSQVPALENWRCTVVIYLPTWLPIPKRLWFSPVFIPQHIAMPSWYDTTVKLFFLLIFILLHCPGLLSPLLTCVFFIFLFSLPSLCSLILS